MAAKGKKSSKPPESEADRFGDNIRLGDDAHALFVRAGTVGAVSLLLSLILGLTADDLSQFMHSYLLAFMYVLSIGLGALFWVTLQNLVNAKWSVVIRRVGEILASNVSLLAVLAMPIVVPMLFGNATLYPWADVDKVHEDHLLHHKAAYLNVGFFAIRFLVYFAFWAALARFMLDHSTRQDESGKPEETAVMRRVSGPAMILFALTLTFAAFDFLMSLDPYWFSTIFGVYFFAGCVVSWHSFFALSLFWLQSKGRLVKSVTQEHFHDIGKMMFAFTVFWAYIAFSQFMLIWYANIPEETAWYKERFAGDWKYVSAALLFGNFVIPFFGLLSRHVKRHRRGLAIGAVWILVVHWVDLYWLVMPSLSPEHLPFHALDITCLLGIGGLFIAGAAFQAKRRNLVPIKDPRLSQSLAFENI